MVTSIHIGHQSNHGFDFPNLISLASAYVAEIKDLRKKKRTEKLNKNRENIQKAQIDDLLFNPAAQKKFFDFCTDLVISKTAEILKDISKEEAILFCEAFESDLATHLDKLQDDLSSLDSGTMEEFYTLTSVKIFVNAIYDLYESVLSISLNKESKQFDEFLKSELEVSKKGAYLYVGPKELTRFLDEL